MFKSLLRTLPSLSGNVKLVCDVSNITENNDEYAYTYVSNASLEPISKNIYKNIVDINLFKSRYDYDLAKFYNIYNDVFYKSMYEYSKVDAKKIDKYHESNERDKDFEFGCSRISYSVEDKQFEFFAPIYIDNVFDIPRAFVIKLDVQYGDYVITKKLKINISDDIEDLSDSKTNIIYNSKNLLFNYIYNYVFNIDNKIIYIDYNNTSSNMIYYYGIDLKHGGFTTSQDINSNIIFTEQQTINNFDNIICCGFKNTNTCMKQILPLSFKFNISDLFSEYKNDKLYFSNVKFSGYYINRNNDIEDLVDFDINYDELKIPVRDINRSTGDIISIPGKIDNLMNASFPSLQEKYFYKYQFMNRISPNTTRWILGASYDNDENYNYIINNNNVFSINQDSQYKYRYFPIQLNLNNNIGICNQISLDTSNHISDYNYNDTNNINVTYQNRIVLYNLLVPLDKKVSINLNMFKQYEIYNTRLNKDIFSNYLNDRLTNKYDFFNIIFHDNNIYNILNNNDNIKFNESYNKFINPKEYKLLQHTYNDVSIFSKSGDRYNILWHTPKNDCVYYNDILYNLTQLYNVNIDKINDRFNAFLSGDSNVKNSVFEIAKANKLAKFIDDQNYDNFKEAQKITKFGVFVVPFFKIIDNINIRSLYNINNLFTLENDIDNTSNYNIIQSSINILDKNKLNIYNAYNSINAYDLNVSIASNNNLYIEDTDISYTDVFNSNNISYTYIDNKISYYMISDALESSSYNNLYINYDELNKNILNDNNKQINKYIEKQTVNKLSDFLSLALNIEKYSSYVSYIRSIIDEFSQLQTIDSYELIPIYNINNISYESTNSLNYSSYDFKQNANSILYYKLQDNNIITTNNTNINSYSNSIEILNNIKYASADNRLLLFDSTDNNSIPKYNDYDYTLYNKKEFIEISTPTQLSYLSYLTNVIYKLPDYGRNNVHHEYSFLPYVKNNGNIVIKNVMMKDSIELYKGNDKITDENDINYLWTDTFNLCNLFKQNGLDSRLVNEKSREFYCDFINTNHLSNYMNYISANENMQYVNINSTLKPLTQFQWKQKSLNDSNNNEGPLATIYVMDKILVINKYNNECSVKYRYVRLYDWLKDVFSKYNLEDKFAEFSNKCLSSNVYSSVTKISDGICTIDLHELYSVFEKGQSIEAHLVYRKKFYQVDNNIMCKLSNLFDENGNILTQSNEFWCDFYFSRTLSNSEYDTRHDDDKYVVLSTDEYNDIIQKEDNKTLFSDNDKSNLTPIYNDVFYEQKKNTQIYTLVNLNNIKSCKYYDTGDYRYRYSLNQFNNFISINELLCDKILDIYSDYYNDYHKDNKLTALEYWIADKFKDVKIYKKYSSNTDILELLTPEKDSEYDYLGLYNHNLFTYNKDGEIYGFYLFSLNLNNTSEIFDSLKSTLITLDSENHKSLADISKFDSFDNHPFFNLKMDNFNVSTEYSLDGQKYFNEHVYQLLPLTKINTINSLSNLKDVIKKPYITNLNINYISSDIKSTKDIKEHNIIYSKLENNNIVNIKTINMTRYFGWIMPRFRNIENLMYNNKFNYVFNLKCKYVNEPILEDYIYNSINDTPLDYWLEKNNEYNKYIKPSVKDYSTVNSIYKYAPLSLFGISNSTTIKNYENYIGNHTDLEYKHFNCSKFYNLPKRIIVSDNTRYNYNELLNISTDSVCIQKFANYIKNYDNHRISKSHSMTSRLQLCADDILFLYNRYNCSVKTNCVGISNNKGNTERQYAIQYVYDLI